MKNLSLAVLIAGLFAACSSKTPTHIVDANGSGSNVDGGELCNVLTQTGCTAGQKCTWLHDAPMLGHIGCAPAGTAAAGAACTYGADGATGFDTCAAGLECQGTKCKTICDQAGGAPTCPTNFACSTYEGLFGPAGQPVAAGVCDPSCNPLADNDFDGSAGSAVKTGSACPGATVGCYGYPDDTKPTKWSCTGEVNPTVVHRTLCTKMAGGGNGCQSPSGGAYINGCAQGYLPLLRDMTGGTGVVCIAMCAPVNTSTANPGSPTGAAPHHCNNTDARGTFKTIANNGDQCTFSWFFEIDTMNNFVRSPTSDTVGFCVDHSQYKYDSNNDGMLNGSDLAWPSCPSLPTGPGSGAVNGAADFGCEDSTKAMLFTGKTGIHRPLAEMPRPMYHMTNTPTL